MSEPIEFDCRDCGRHVIAFDGIGPDDARCSTCFWINEHIPPHEQAAGCGLRVLSFGRDTMPRLQFCAVCEWLNEHETPARIMEMRRRCEPGGWEPERMLRRLPPQSPTP